jgi:hypothetical protein
MISFSEKTNNVEKGEKINNEKKSTFFHFQGLAIREFRRRGVRSGMVVGWL